MKILVDIDGVLADFAGHLVNWLNYKGHGAPRPEGNYRVEEFTSYDLVNHIPPRILAQAPHDPNFAYSIPRHKGAQQFVKDLVAQGHDITLVTAPWTGPHHQRAREEWVESILSFKDGHKVGFEWVTPTERPNMGGELLIEDRHETANAWAGTGRACLLVDRPWNRHFPPTANVHRHKTYDEMVDTIRGKKA